MTMRHYKMPQTCSGRTASSIHHFGQMAKQRLEMARRQTAALLPAAKKGAEATQ